MGFLSASSGQTNVTAEEKRETFRGISDWCVCFESLLCEMTEDSYLITHSLRRRASLPSHRPCLERRTLNKTKQTIIMCNRWVFVVNESAVTHCVWAEGIEGVVWWTQSSAGFSRVHRDLRPEATQMQTSYSNRSLRLSARLHESDHTKHFLVSTSCLN